MKDIPETPENEPPSPAKKKPKLRLLTLLLCLLMILALLLLAIWAYAYRALGDEKQSKQLLATISQLQPNFKYKEASGNLRDGLRLQSVSLKVAETTLFISNLNIQSSVQSLLRPGNLWSLLSQQQAKRLDITNLNVDTLTIYNHKAKEVKPFAYKAIRLPVDLVVNRLGVKELIISGVGRKPVTLTQLQGEQISWQGTKLTIGKNAQFVQQHVHVNQLTGTVDFSKHYLVNAQGNLVIPALQRFNAQAISIKATGDLKTTHISGSTNWPDPLELTGTLAPFEQNTPFKATVTAKHWQFPFARGQKIELRNATLETIGSSKGLQFNVNTALDAKHIPTGSYSAYGRTDYKAMTLDHLSAQILGGQADIQGQVNWYQQVAWDIKGKVKQVKPHRYVNGTVGRYLPLQMTGSLVSKGKLKDGKTTLWQQWSNSQTNAEQIQLHMQKQERGWLIQTSWTNLPLALPTGNQFAKTGSANVLVGNNQVVEAAIQSELSDDKRAFMPHFASNRAAHIHLPAGKYSANLVYAGKAPLLQLHNVKYSGNNGSLSTQLNIMPATAKSPLKIAIFNNQINLHSLKRILPNIPINALSGSANTTIIIDNRLNKKIIQLDQSNLSANLQLLGKATPLKYNGKGIIHLLSPKARLPVYAIALNGMLSSPLGQNAPINTTLQGDSQGISISQLQLGDANSPLLGTIANVQLKPLAWQLQAQSSGLNVSYWLPQLSAPIIGNINSKGKWDKQDKKIVIEQTNISTVFNNQAANIQGELYVDVHALGQQWTQLKRTGQTKQFVSNLQKPSMSKWANADIRTLMQGNLTAQFGSATAALVSKNTGADPWQLRFNIPQLQAFTPKAAGAIQGTLTADASAQHANLAVSLEQLKAGQWAAGSGQVTALLPMDGMQQSQMKANLYNVSGKQNFSEVAAHATGNRAAHTINIAANNVGKAAALRFTGTLNAQEWIADMSHGVVIAHNQRLAQTDTAAVRLRLQKPQLTIAKHCWQGVGQLCFTEKIVASKANGQAKMRIADMSSTHLSMFMPKGLFWNGQLNGTIDFSWLEKTPPQLALNLKTDGGKIGLESEDPQDLPMIVDYDNITLNVDTKATGLDLRLDIHTPNVGAGYLQATVNPNVTPKTINGAMVLDNIQLAVLKRFFPLLYSIEGTGQISGGLSGALAAPQIYANMVLSNGSIVAKNLPLNLNNIQLNAFVRGQEGTFNGNFNSGAGQAALSGNIAWPNGLKLEAALQGTNLALVQPPMLSATLSPKLQLNVNSALKHMQIKGHVDVSDTLLTPPPSSDKIYKASPDVVVIDRTKPTTPSTPRIWDMDNLIHVNIKDNVNFAGYGANIPLEGEIILSQQRTEKLQANGEVRISRQSNVQAFGQTMLLRRGSILFNGALNYPNLDIEALKNIDNKEVGLSVYGTILAPKVTLFNNAGLSEQESLNALIIGKIRQENTANVAGFQSDANSTLAAAGLSFMLSGSHQLTNSIGRAVGLNALHLDASSENADTNIHVTGYLTPDLYVRYGRSVLTPVNKLTLRYQVNKRTYLEASSALERAVDIFYNWRF